MGIFSKKKNDDFYNLIQEKSSKNPGYVLPEPQKKETPNPEHVLTSDEILSSNAPQKKAASPASNSDPLAAMRKRMLKNVGVEESEEDTTPKGEDKSPNKEKEDVNDKKDTLLERCLPYIIDENGKNSAISDKPLYELESVADILRGESRRSIETLSEKYDISIDYLEKNKGKIAEHTSIQEEPKKIEVAESKAEPEEIKVTHNEDKNAKIFEEIVAGLNAANEEKVEPLPDISDIDNAVSDRDRENLIKQNTATVTFTPIKQKDDTQRISVSSLTRPVDLSDEFNNSQEIFSENMSEAVVEQSDFEEFTPKFEFTDSKEAKKIFRALAIKKRNSFLRLCFTVLISAAMLLFAIPEISAVFSSAATGMTVCASLLGALILINMDMFISLKTFVSKRSSPDCLAVLAVLSVLALSVASAITGEEQYQMAAVGAITLLFRAMSSFFAASSRCGNFRQIISPHPKKAVTLLSDTATTFSMAKNAVEGDALVAAPRETGLLCDFMKYSEYSSVLGDKMRVVSIAGVLLAAIMGFVSAAYFESMIYGFFASAATLCFVAAPTVFFIDTLPCYFASKRLNKKGAMIAGIAAARHIETANTTVLKANELFPEGTVSMCDITVLSENNIDDIFMRAASLTAAVNSPLAPIFKRIAVSNNTYTIPDSDTVKYEERMGVSGWVKDELLFIGNRTLMLAHGIPVPDIETDRRILRSGCFPVYLASGGKACALLSVKYDVDEQVAYELHKLTGMGVTLLVDNCDPNLSDDMIYDYIGLYPDSVKVMSTAGVNMYRNAVSATDKCSAPACFRGKPINLISVINCASRVKRCNTFLNVFYVLAAVLGVVIFAYVSFAGSDMPPSAVSVMLSQLACAAISYVLALFTKP